MQRRGGLSSLVASVLIVVLVFTPVPEVNAEKRKKRARAGDDGIRRKELELFLEDAKNREATRCYACAVSAFELQRGLTSKQVSGPEMEDLSETICAALPFNYALKFENDKPVHEFTNNPDLTRARTKTTDDMLQTICLKLVGHYVAALIHDVKLEQSFGLDTCRKVKECPPAPAQPGSEDDDEL